MPIVGVDGGVDAGAQVVKATARRGYVLALPTTPELRAHITTSNNQTTPPQPLDHVPDTL